MKFYLHDEGDSSVGISAYGATVEITRTPDPEFTEDEIEALKDGLRDALCPDGKCLTEAEAQAEADADRARYPDTPAEEEQPFW